ncbi:MAG: SAF domain-containing protein [Actinomycetota bacterium]
MNNVKKASQTRLVVAIALFAAAVISAMALTALGNRSDTYWVARHSLIPGSQILEGDLSQVQVALGQISSDYFSKDSDVIGSYALRAIAKNELISISSVSDMPRGALSGQVPISIHGSDLPSDIEIGEKLDIYWVPEAMGIQKTEPSTLVISGAFLNSINRKASNFGNDISLTVSVTNSEIFSLLQATSSGRLVIVRANG